MIEGVEVQELKQFVDERGRVMHMLRKDSSLFKHFGEIYFSEIIPGVIKAWKRHKKMTQLLAVPIGKVRLVIYDDRKKSTSKGMVEVMELSRDNYLLVRIPPKLWYGFKCTSDHPALIANCSDMPHLQDEVENRDASNVTIPYQW